MDVSGQNHAPAALHPERALLPIVQEAGWASGPVWTGAENLPSPEFELRTIYPVTSHYTDWPNPAAIFKLY
jgi:hypothetical protein